MDIKRSFNFVLAISSLLTSLVVLISVPNSAWDYIHDWNWVNNVSLLTLNTNDYTVFFNGNSSPVFIERYELETYAIGQIDYIEVMKMIPSKDYLKFENEGHNWKEIYKEDIHKIIRPEGGVQKPWYLIYVNEENPLFKKLLSKFGPETKFTWYLPGKAVVYVRNEKGESSFEKNVNIFAVKD